MTAPALAEVALSELREREVVFPQLIAQGKKSADEAGRTIAAWRAIEQLLRCGEARVEPVLGSTPAAAFPALVEAAHSAVAYRARRNDAATPALREIRNLILIAAVRAGAQVPSFDPLAEVGPDGPDTKAAA